MACRMGISGPAIPFRRAQAPSTASRSPGVRVETGSTFTGMTRSDDFLPICDVRGTDPGAAILLERCRFHLCSPVGERRFSGTWDHFCIERIDRLIDATDDGADITRRASG